MIVLQASLCLLFAFAVFAFGAVQVWPQAIIETGAAVLLVFWSVLFCRDSDAKIQWNPLNWPLLGVILIGILQLLLHGTAYAFLTRTELLRFSAYLIIFFLLAQAFSKRTEFEGLAWFLMLLCFVVSLLGIVEHFTADNQMYWMSSFSAQNDFFGPFVNRNHFAGFVELTLPTGLALAIFRGIRKELFPLVILLTIVPVSALILSASRAGIIGFGFELCVLAVLARIRRKENAPKMAALGIIAVAAVVLIAWVGAGKAIQRFSAVSKVELTFGRRASMAHAAGKIFLDHPIKGTGLGTLGSVYPRYETLYDGLVVEHVHNDYLEGLAEMGIAGGICGLAFLWLLYRESRRSFTASQGHFSLALHAGAIAGVTGLLFHSFLDFNLHIPSNALLFLVQAFLATSIPLPTRARPQVKKPVGREFSAVSS
jgi:O-antigen ligase